MASEFDKLSDLAKDAAKEVKTDNRSSIWCYFFHNWSKWKLSENTKYQTRHCMSCNEFQKKHFITECEHRWKFIRGHEVTKHEQDEVNRKIGISFLSQCSKCGIHRQDYFPAGESYNVDF